MPLMTKEDENLYNILKQHDEAGVLIDKEHFSTLGDKQTPVNLVLAGLTEITLAGRVLGYKALADRENEIREAYKAAEEERSNPDPSFNAAGMNELYDALEKEHQIKNHTEFPSKDKFMQLKLNEKVRLVEDLIEGTTDGGVVGYMYDAGASILGAEKYGTKLDRERMLYSAAKALDQMLPTYQERNPDEPAILPYAHRDIMDKLYGNIYRDIESHLVDSGDLPPRSEFYAMPAQERNEIISQLMEDDNQNALTDGVYFTGNKRNEILQSLNDIDKNKNLLTMDQLIKTDEIYGDIYSGIAENSDGAKKMPSRSEFYVMSAEDKINIVHEFIPDRTGRLDDFRFSINPKKELLKKLKVANNEAEKLDIEPYKIPSEELRRRSDLEINSDLDHMDNSFDANSEETRLVESKQSKKSMPPYIPADVYVDHESGEKIQLKPEQTKEGVLFKFPEEPYNTLIIERGSEKTGFRFEPTQEAIEKKENITIETPCLDADGKEIPGKFEKLIFNPATNEMLLHKIPDGFNSRLDQNWLAKFEDKTPKSRSRVTIGTDQDLDSHELSEENLSKRSKTNKSNNDNRSIDSLSVSSSDDDTEVLNYNEMQKPKSSSLRESLTNPAASSTSGADSTKKLVVPDPNKVVANMKKQTAARANPRPQEIAAYLETEDGKFSLGRDSAGNFVLGSQVIIEVKPNGKDFEVKGKGKYTIDVPTSGGNINRHSYNKGKKTSEPILTISPANPAAIKVENATTIGPPSSGTNVSMNKKGGRDLL
jgi:hypothetical protein